MPLEFSPNAQEAMHHAGGFVLAGEASQPAATAEDLGIAPAPVFPLGLSADLAEAAQEHLNVRMLLEDQFEFNGRLLTAMGLKMPGGNAFSPSQSSKLEQRYDETASSVAGELTRLVIAPLFPSDSNLVQNRQNMLRSLRDSMPDTALTTNREPLWTPYDGEWAYGHLLQNPNSTSKNDSSQEGEAMLCYRASQHKLVDRVAYLFQAGDQDLAIMGGKSTLWTYNFADIRPITPRSPSKNVKALFEDLSLTNTPEQELTIQALHLITGQQNTTFQVNITNEAVYNLGRENNPKPLRSAAGVYWSAGDGNVVLVDLAADARYNDDLGLRASVSGL